MQAVKMNEQAFQIGWMKNIVEFVIQNFSEEITLDDLSNVAGLTKFHLCRTFQKRYGLTPMRWVWRFRTILAGEILKCSRRWNLTDVAFTCGFTSSAHFSRSFRGVHNVSPTQFRTVSADESPEQGDLYVLANKFLAHAMTAAVSA